MSNNSNIGEQGVTIFDGSCGACSTFIGRNGSFFNKYGFSVTPLQEKWVRDLTGLSEEKLLQAIHLYTKDARIFSGIDFLEHFASKVWWLYPISFLSKIRFLKPLFSYLYNFIARKRHAISKACKLESKAFYK